MRLRECTATRTQRAATPRTLLYQHGRQPRWSSRSSTRTCWVCDARVLSCRSLTPHPRASVHHHTQPRESAPRSKPRAFSFSLSRFFAARAARAGSSTSSRVAVSLVSRCARGPAARVDRRVPSREIHPIRSTAPHHPTRPRTSRPTSPPPSRATGFTSPHPYPASDSRLRESLCARAGGWGLGYRASRGFAPARARREERSDATSVALRFFCVLVGFGSGWGVGGGGRGAERVG